MDNPKLLAYSTIRWKALPIPVPTDFYGPNTIFKADYKEVDKQQIYLGTIDHMSKMGLRIRIASGGGMLLEHLTNIEYCFVRDIEPVTPLSNNSPFTKLELASLMIAEGLTKRDFADPYSPEGVSTISKSAVNLAKAVLEEANK